MDYAIARRRMVEQQLVARGVTDERVLAALQEIPRHSFVDHGLQGHAYSDGPLPIGQKQTISQPYIVAVMSAALNLKGPERVLEVGTGSGYQTAVLARLARRVYSLERIPELGKRARRVLDQLHISNVNIRVIDGSVGWPEQAPYDAILAAAASPEIPPAYLEQLEVGGRLVMPVGNLHHQTLVRVVRTAADSYQREQLLGCRFVPLIGEQGWPQSSEEAQE